MDADLGSLYIVRIITVIRGTGFLDAGSYRVETFQR